MRYWLLSIMALAVAGCGAPTQPTAREEPPQAPEAAAPAGPAAGKPRPTRDDEPRWEPNPRMEVTAAAIAPDNKLALTGYHADYPDEPRLDGAIHVWDVATGRRLRTLFGHRGRILGLAFLPDGKHAISGGSDGALKLWDVVSGTEVHSFARDKGVSLYRLAVTADGQRAACGYSNGKLKVWDLATYELLLEVTAHPLSIRALALSPDGRFAATACNPNTKDNRVLRIWDLSRGQSKWSFKDSELVSEGVFSPDGKLVFCQSVSGAKAQKLELVFWNVIEGREVRRLAIPPEALMPFSFRPDGRYFVSKDKDYTLRLYDVADGKALWALPLGDVRVVAFSPDAALALAAGGYESMSTSLRLDLYDTAYGKHLRSFAGPHKPRPNPARRLTGCN
jgi:WD40 repeat protein